jgi:hypothetical protein
MRLEGRSGLRAQLRKAGVASVSRLRRHHEQNVRFITFAPDWCQAACDVASASELQVAGLLLRRSVTAGAADGAGTISLLIRRILHHLLF